MTRLQVQEQAAGSSGAPPDYKGRIKLDPILLDVGGLVAALETGVFELSNTRVHQNLLLHHIGRSMARSSVLLRELCNMAGRAYCPADLLEISWRDLQWVEMQWRASPSQREEVPVRGGTGARGDRRGRCWGDILSDCSYSCASSRGRDGGGVGIHGGVLGQLITVA